MEKVLARDLEGMIQVGSLELAAVTNRRLVGSGETDQTGANIPLETKPEKLESQTCFVVLPHPAICGWDRPKDSPPGSGEEVHLGQYFC